MTIMISSHIVLLFCQKGGFMGFGSFGVKLATIFGRSPQYGKLIGKSAKSGIAVFKKIDENGKCVIRSFKNGKHLKTITKTNYKLAGSDIYRTTGSGRKTVALNHETGITTTVKKEEVSTLSSGTYIRENRFSKYCADSNGKGTGLTYHLTKRPNNSQYMRETKYRFSEDGNVNYQRSYVKYNSTDYDLFVGVSNYKMPNGQIVSGNHYFKNRYSYIDDKMTRYDGYRGWFTNYHLNKDGNMVVNKSPHNWFNSSANPRYCRERGGIQYS